MQKVENKMKMLTDKFVTSKTFEFKMEDVKVKIDDHKMIQNQINDNIADKFDTIFQTMEKIRSETVTHEKLEQELEKFTRLTRFVRVEAE